MDLGAIERMLAAFLDETDGAGMKSRELILGLLAHTPDPLSRHQFAPGHITCTGLVLGPSLDRILLVDHARLKRWLLPGGHVEPGDASPAESARREVIEETGVELDSAHEPFLAGLDVHGIPPRKGEPFHLHHDLVFGFRARSESVVCSQESRAVAWCAESEFHHCGVPNNVRLAWARVRA
jgi:8-oxo-dGTP pyrophosphatase MutT (NUDIX family)